MAEAFNEIIHAPIRLKICAMLYSVEELEFPLLRDALHISDSVLSKHLKVLEQASYVKLRKSLVNTRPRTWIALTSQGSEAFSLHVQELQRLVGSLSQ